MHDDEWVWRNTRSSQTNDDKIGIFCFLAKLAALRSIMTDYMYVVLLFVITMDDLNSFHVFSLIKIL
jgi:hypothetical protein